MWLYVLVAVGSYYICVYAVRSHYMCVYIYAIESPPHTQSMHIQCQVSTISALHPIFWNKVFHWTWSSLFWLECLTKEPQGSACLSLSQCWAYRCYEVAGDLNMGLHGCSASTLPTEHLPNLEAIIFYCSNSYRTQIQGENTWTPAFPSGRNAETWGTFWSECERSLTSICTWFSAGGAGLGGYGTFWTWGLAIRLRVVGWD